MLVLLIGLALTGSDGIRAAAPSEISAAFDTTDAYDLLVVDSELNSAGLCMSGSSDSIAPRSNTMLVQGESLARIRAALAGSSSKGETLPPYVVGGMNFPVPMLSCSLRSLSA